MKRSNTGHSRLLKCRPLFKEDSVYNGRNKMFFVHQICMHVQLFNYIHVYYLKTDEK